MGQWGWGMGPPSLTRDGDRQGTGCSGLRVRSDQLPHLGAVRPGSSFAVGLLAAAWDRRPPAGPPSPWPLSSSEPPPPSSGLLRQAFSELAGSTGLTLGVPSLKALDVDTRCWLLFIDLDQHCPP